MKPKTFYIIENKICKNYAIFINDENNVIHTFSSQFVDSIEHLKNVYKKLKYKEVKNNY